MDDQAFLKRIPFFSGVLDPGDLDRLAAGARRTDYDRGAIIVREGDRGASMFAIVKGTATVSIRDGKEERTVATLHDGDIVGEMSLLTGAPRSATVAALRPVVALEIPKDALEPILAAAPELADRFARMVEERKAELDAAHGPLHWLRPSGQAAHLASAIRRFFAAPE